MAAGYKQIRIKGKRIKYHRWIMEQHLGRKLTPDEVVHHINENIRDNRIENLKVMNNKEHTSFHHGGKPSPKPKGWKPANFGKRRDTHRLGSSGNFK